MLDLETLKVQLSTLCGVPFWYLALTSKLDKQISAIALQKLPHAVASSYRKVLAWSYWKARYKGIGTELTVQPLFPFAFTLKEWIGSKLAERGQEITPFQQIFAATLAGGATGFVATPPIVTIVRLRQHPHESVLTAIRQIWQTSGVRSFFSGSVITCGRNAGFGGAFFGLNPEIENYLNERVTFGGSFQPLLAGLIASIFSGVTASICTMPFDNLSVRRQLNAMANKSHSLNELFIQTLVEQGCKGFFVGTRGRVLASCIEFLSYKVFSNFWDHALGEEQAQE